MKFDIRQYSQMLSENNIHVIYSGPIWSNGIDGMAEMVLKRLEYEEMPLHESQAVFSIFVEQVNNMMMYSADKERKSDAEGNSLEISNGIFILGVQGTTYFIQTGNVVTSSSAEILKERIDFLNTLDKKELRQYYRQQLNAENDNPESKGAGIGLIEVARRASGHIDYEFQPYDDGCHKNDCHKSDLQYFSMYLTVKQGEIVSASQSRSMDDAAHAAKMEGKE